MVGPQVKRQAVDVLREERGFGVTRACGLVHLSVAVRYRSRRPACSDLRERISVLAARSVATDIGASTSCCAVRGGR